MSVHVLLNLLNKLRKGNKMRGLPNIVTSLINLITQEYECKILFIICH